MADEQSDKRASRSWLFDTNTDDTKKVAREDRIPWQEAENFSMEVFIAARKAGAII